MAKETTAAPTAQLPPGREPILVDTIRLIRSGDLPPLMSSFSGGAISTDLAHGRRVEHLPWLRHYRVTWPTRKGDKSYLNRVLFPETAVQYAVLAPEEQPAAQSAAQ